MWTHAPQKSACSRSGAVETDMSGASRYSGLDMKPLEYQWALPNQRTLVQTCMLSRSMLPLPASSGSRIKEDFRLPSLARSTHGRTTTVPLSISEPSLFTPSQWSIFGGFSGNCCPPLRQHVPSRKTPENTKMPQQSYHQVYMHFSQPLRPILKAGKSRPCSQRQTTERKGLQPLVRQCRQPLNHETLSVRGKTYLPSQPLPTAASATSRTELHIFLPAEGAGEEEGRDSESVDEGFMDELDNKLTTLRLQQDPKISKESDTAEPLMADVVQITS